MATGGLGSLSGSAYIFNHSPEQVRRGDEEGDIGVRQAHPTPSAAEGCGIAVLMCRVPVALRDATGDEEGVVSRVCGGFTRTSPEEWCAHRGWVGKENRN